MGVENAAPPARGGVPVWVWCVIVPCGCLGVAVVFTAIFGAMAFPVFATARTRARKAACLSNLKQQSLGLLMYVQDYDERYPPAQGWMDLAVPYIKNETVNHCPEAVSKNGSAYGYAFNSRMSRVLLKNVNQPQTTPMTYDSTTLTRSAFDPIQSLPSPPRHLNSNNISYADGHARSVGSASAGQ